MIKSLKYGASKLLWLSKFQVSPYPFAPGYFSFSFCFVFFEQLLLKHMNFKNSLWNFF